jgi:hypothetical protein
MTQQIIVVLAIAGAAIYLIKLVHSHFISKKSKCDGCAIHKIYSEKQQQ